MTIDKIRFTESCGQFLKSTTPLELQMVTREESYSWIEKILRIYKYLKLNKEEKEVLRTYMMKMTGFSSTDSERVMSLVKIDLPMLNAFHS